MDRLKIAIAIVFAALSFIAGIYITADKPVSGSDEMALEKPDYAQNEVTPSNEIQINTLKDFNDAIVNVAEQANPAVVTITTTQTVRVRQQSPFSFFFDDPRFDQEREYQRSGLGSGVIVSEEGYILTNNHVIERADDIRVILYEGEELEAEIVGTDPASDIAVLKVDQPGLTAIPMGDSETIRTGEMVLAIGSPLSQDFAHTVSKGIISASGRTSLGLNVFENYIQTDAAINPGNSGGALINLDGELIGINTAIASRSGGSQGIGFAIPVNMARDVMEALITEGRVSRGYLGISFGGEVDATMARALGLDSPGGVVVGEVVPDGPADEAGLQDGDVIVKLDGEEFDSWRDFRVAIGSKKPGDTIELEVFREGETMEYTIELGELETEAVAENMTSDDMEDVREALGFSVDELTDSVRQQLNLSSGIEGVVVTNISQGSNAYRQGLRRGDVVMQVADQIVANPDDFYGAVKNLMDQGTDAALLRVNRQGRNVFIAIEL
ncbi:MAG TPA: Do family serine endopeptidase [Balneolaceae bacterium]|nr:Do family serine endopeptidase [Balneolaceae bacterium]